jgi:hypothetical protein
MAAIFILVKWLFWWLFGPWLPQNIFLHRCRQGRRQRLMLRIRSLKFVKPAMTRFSNHPGKEASLLTKIRRLLRGVTPCKPNSS